MDQSLVMQRIIAAVSDYTGVEAARLSAATALFGASGLLDSIGLVNVVLDVEQRVAQETGTALTIADERAMSQKRSPFRTVGSLAEYVAGLLGRADGSPEIRGSAGVALAPASPRACELASLDASRAQAARARGPCSPASRTETRP